MNFDKVQNSIAPENAIFRQHAIPLDVRTYAGQLQLGFTGQRGRGRANVPSLADIYFTLVKEGYAMLRLLDVPPTLVEIGQPDGCVMTKIKFDLRTDLDLRDLKDRVKNGEYETEPFNEISLISLAVNLMRIAIEARENNIMPPEILEISKKKLSGEVAGAES